ncbi:murein L,D-transpeptidase catalytic domain family protein [Croceibacterium ferulae]|uniref:murein L,D-transpeptidase catalytic domain family protein n=1 Tax=Croceibacterium ferulae TaxID=1854641 RepID=UPI000EB55BDB|nr:murein L,D-transpeptidase catalytic domain family protein [Croceibacterium ferulae]
MDLNRRQMILAGGVFAATSMLAGGMRTERAGTGSVAPRSAPVPAKVAAAPAIQPAMPAALLAAAKGALDRQGPAILRDRIAVVDFAVASAEPRLHLVDLLSGKVRSLLVTHGSGSDPDHSGWTKRFSNMPGSNASSEGAYATQNYYSGKHGRSQRLAGLDASNSNALERAIVIHGAWYAEPGVVDATGKLGRSQGCFAVGDTLIDDLFDHLGSSRLLYAAKLAA